MRMDQEAKAVVNVVRLARALDLGQITPKEYRTKLKELAAYVETTPGELERIALCRLASACGPWGERAIWHHLQDFIDDIIEAARRAGWKMKVIKLGGAT